MNYLRGSWLDDLLGGNAYDIALGGLTYTGTYNWVSGIALEFSGSSSYGKRIPVGLSQSVSGIGPAYTEMEATIDVAFAFELSLGWGDSTGATYGFNVTQLDMDASLNSADVVFPLMIGDLEAAAGHPQHAQGTVDLRGPSESGVR